MTNQKILYIVPKDIQVELPEKIKNQYKVITALSTTTANRLIHIIVEQKPQLIIFAEHVSINIIRRIQKQFKFIPICVIGSFQNPKLTERILQLGVTTINISQNEQEISSTIETLLWFSLSREEFWQEEYNLAKSEILTQKVYTGIKIVAGFAIVLGLIFVIPKLYTMITYTKPFYTEVDLKYLSPSDITVVGDKYIVCDWSVRTLFEYEISTNELIKTYTPEEQFNSITANDSGYFFTSSVFSNKVFIYKYPDFSIVISTVTLLRDNTILSMHFISDSLYVLDNKKTLYSFVVDENNKFVLTSSVTIREFFPVDIYTHNKYILLLDNNNNIYMMNKDNYVVEARIILDKYFDVKNVQFTSIAISKDSLFLVSEKAHRVYKLPLKLIT
ncbi:MAG: hypothetical protein NZ928_04110 [Endomicrobia bacterium]|nr:hypothetical protein [Endomicrobiia bacterium]MDW8056079.1 hypothetical protein [Elusimicrobiota bacterium]